MQPISSGSSVIPWYARRYVALILGIVLVIVVPLLLRWDQDVSYFTSWTSINTFIAGIAGVVLGTAFSQRLQYFPGVSFGGIVIVAYVTSFGLVALILLFFYLDYSRAIYLSSAVAALFWFLFVNFLRKRVTVLRFHYVPGTDLEEFSNLPHVRIEELQSPDDFSGIRGAVVADLRSNLSAEWVQFLAECALQEIPVYHVKHVREHMTGKVQIEHLSENTLGSILPSKVYLSAKRAVDTLLALALLPFIALVMVFIVPAMLVTQGRPVIFRQTRIGMGGQPFTVFKLRTMLRNDELDAMDMEALRESAATKHDDPRITPMGRFLRKYRIDELPQVINVLKGEMSFIGPRPEAEVLGQLYEEKVPFYRYRYIVRPGISGWAQVSQGHVTDVDDISVKLQYDFFYVKHLSAWLDVLIVLRTLRTVLFGTGAK